MDKLISIISGTCLKHHDSGEASCNREARLIIAALESEGYEIRKKDSSDNKVKTFYFNRWLATQYADEKLDSNMNHTSSEDFDPTSALSVLNRETGVWYMQQMDIFSRTVYPIIKNNQEEAFDLTEKMLNDVEF